jgi:AcrR family transcriptional regulator
MARDLPPELAVRIFSEPIGLPKRERTRRQLLTAALGLFSERGMEGVTIQDIAAAAGMATATVYNHFRTRDEVIHGVASWFAETLCRTIDETYAHIGEGAERMAIGNRRYVWLAERSPGWALLLLDVMAAAPQVGMRILEYPRADLRLGIRQKAFRVASEQAAMDLISGTVSSAMRSVALGLAPPGHGSAVATTVLRGLGVPFEEAARIANRQLPDLAAPAAATARGEARGARAAATRRRAAPAPAGRARGAPGRGG